MGVKFKKVFSKKNLKRAGTALLTGGASEAFTGIGTDSIEEGYKSISGISAAEDAQKRALAGLEGNIAEGQALSEVGLQQQLGVLDDTFGDQRSQIGGALSGANIADRQALAQYMQAQGANRDQISAMLSPQADLQGQFMGSVADASTLDGMGNMLNQVRESDTYNSLLGERMDAAQNQFADAGLRRSTTAGEGAADIAQSTLMDLGNQAYNRQLGMLNMGNQGVANQANFLNQANTNMNATNMNTQNMMNQRGYQNQMGIADLIGNTGTNRSNLMGTNTSNQMNLLGQLGQAQAANQIAQGQNAMNTRMGVLNLAGTIGGAALTGGASLGLGGMFGGGGGGLGATQAGYSPQYMNSWSN
jgi:hypothetical protein